MEPKYVLLSWKFIPPYVGKRPNITIIIWKPINLDP